MFLHHSLVSGMMAETFFENSNCNFTRQPYMSHFTVAVTPQCLLLAATAVKRSLDNWSGGTHLRQQHSTPCFAKLSPRLGGAGFYFGFTPYHLAVSACFCKCISLFQSSHYHSALTSTGSLPSNSPPEVLHQLSKTTTCLWIHQYMRSGTYQRSIREVPSSGWVLRYTLCTSSSNRLQWRRPASRPPLGRSTRSGLTITSPFRPPHSSQVRRWSARREWPREFHFRTSICPALLSFRGRGIPQR